MIPTRIQRQRVKGWKMPENTVSVTRPGKWGNPFPCGGNNEAAVKAFKEWIDGKFKYEAPPPSKEEIRKELKGKNLACWCKIGEPCHGDILLKIANETNHSL